MSDFTTFEADTVIIRVPIVREDTGQPLDLTNAAIEAIAQRRGRPSISASVEILDAVGGICRVSWPAETFDAAVYDWQLRVDLFQEVQTVVSGSIVAKRSIRGAVP